LTWRANHLGSSVPGLIMNQRLHFPVSNLEALRLSRLPPLKRRAAVWLIATSLPDSFSPALRTGWVGVDCNRLIQQILVVRLDTFSEPWPERSLYAVKASENSCH